MFEGFICEVTGENLPPEVCLRCAHKGAPPGCQLTGPVVRGLLATLRPRETGLTITTLLGCPRQARLKAETDYFLKPSAVYWLFRGQLFHSGLAAHAGDQTIAEERFLILVETAGGLVEVSGQPDLVLLGPEPVRLLDYKTTHRLPAEWKQYFCPESGALIQEGTRSVRTKWITCPHCPEERHLTRQVEGKSPPRPRLRDIWQLSLYRLLLAEHGITVELGEIVYLDMRRLLRLPVDFLPLDETARLLARRVARHTTTGLPPPLTDPEEIWQCDYCPVRLACETRFGGPVGLAEQSSAEVKGPVRPAPINRQH